MSILPGLNRLHFIQTDHSDSFQARLFMVVAKVVLVAEVMMVAKVVVVNVVMSNKIYLTLCNAIE